MDPINPNPERQPDPNKPQQAGQGQASLAQTVPQQQDLALAISNAELKKRNLMRKMQEMRKKQKEARENVDQQCEDLLAMEAKVEAKKAELQLAMAEQQQEAPARPSPLAIFREQEQEDKEEEQRYAAMQEDVLELREAILQNSGKKAN